MANASVVIDRVRDLTQDAVATYRNSDAKLLRYLSDGQRFVAKHKPETVATLTNVTTSAGLTAGATRQTISGISRAFQLLDVVRNTGSGGGTPGKAISATNRELLDLWHPDWHSETNSDGYVKHYVYDMRDPLAYWVWPKCPTNWSLDLVAAIAPADISATSTALTLSDVYIDILTDYTVYRVLLEDSEYAGPNGVAVTYANAVLAALGIKDKAELEHNPLPLSRDAGNPNVV